MAFSINVRLAAIGACDPGSAEKVGQLIAFSLRRTPVTSPAPRCGSTGPSRCCRADLPETSVAERMTIARMKIERMKTK